MWSIEAEQKAQAAETALRELAQWATRPARLATCSEVRNKQARINKRRARNKAARRARKDA